MQITKVIGCILIILSSTLMGFYCSNELKSRINDIKELRKLIILLRGDIRYGSTPLPEAINTIARRHEGSFKGFLIKVSDKLSEHSGNTFSQIWKAAVEKELLQTSLNKKDKSHLIQFGENLGYLDKEMQMNTLELFLTQIEEEINELSKTAKEKSYLYNTLGIMAGIFISIILI
ncbi:MAG: stage III sporulation protein AD [Clostridiales bacterium]|jgi:stage III sporulation protein AB|nr:stage III sporulation protein AD [Clostridiales bacterium]